MTAYEDIKNSIDNLATKLDILILKLEKEVIHTDELGIKRIVKEVK